MKFELNKSTAPQSLVIAPTQPLSLNGSFTPLFSYKLQQLILLWEDATESFEYTPHGWLFW